MSKNPSLKLSSLNFMKRSQDLSVFTNDHKFDSKYLLIINGRF